MERRATEGELMKYEKLFLRLSLRKYLLKQRDYSGYRNQLLNNHRQVSKELFDTVVAECIREGLLTVSKGQKGGEILTWHEEKVADLEVGRG
jgi:hypothetical protein